MNIIFWTMVVFTLSRKVRLKNCLVLLNQRFVCEGLSKISSYFTLHLIKVGKLKRFIKKQVSLAT